MEGEWEDEFPVGEDAVFDESGVDLLRFSSTLAHGLLLIAVGLSMGALGLATLVLAPIGVVAASASSIRSPPLQALGVWSGTPCPICFEALGKMGALTFCGHAFHDHCLGKWGAATYAPSCPLCRAPLRVDRIEVAQ